MQWEGKGRVELRMRPDDQPVPARARNGPGADDADRDEVFNKMKAFRNLILSGLAASLASSLPAADPIERADDSWITLSGTVVATYTDAFVLDYGEGTITVEMDDWDWYDDSKHIVQDDQVVVYGVMDDDLLETATIEASSVFVESLNTFFYADPTDEEKYRRSAAATPTYIDGARIEIEGTVSRIKDREFFVGTGKREIKVDTVSLPYNPLDEFGYQKIEVGDRVKVEGEMDLDVFEKREVHAMTVITLNGQKERKKDDS